MAWHEWAHNVFTILVFEGTDVLDSTRLGAILRRMASILPTRTDRKHQHTCLGSRMQDDHHFNQRRTGGCCSFDSHVQRDITTGQETTY